MNTTLILTSCVNPTSQDSLKLNDPQIRLEQTLSCIKFYIESEAFKNIIVCDGSETNLENRGMSLLASEKEVNLETLFFKQDYKKVASLGKGYGEGEIMAFIFNHSKLIAQTDFFIKITGRLIVSNITEIVSALDSKNTYFNIFPSKYLGCVDTRIYGISKQIYFDYFIDAYKNVNESRHQSYEYCFTDVIQEKKIQITPFEQIPVIEGYSGTSNKKYKKDIIFYVENTMLKLGVMNTKFSAVILLLIHGAKEINKKCLRKKKLKF